MKNTRTLRRLTEGAMIAAIYAVLTFLLWQFSSLQIQVRVSEALCILPLFTPSAVPGLTLGCLLANLLGGNNVWDMIFGSLATLLGAIGTYLLRKRSPYLAVWPPILANTLIIPFVLKYAYELEGAIPYFMLTVGLGELLSVGLLGTLLHYRLKDVPRLLQD